MRLGVLGGTFDPVHLGHLILAEQACWQLQLDRVLWVLTPHPPHKPDLSAVSWGQRLKMLRIALGDNSDFVISEVDINRQPPLYAHGTMNLLREQFPNDQLFFLMGADSLRDLPTWNQPMKFISACEGLGIMKRAGILIEFDMLEAAFPGIYRKLLLIETPQIDISSSDIRQRIATGKPYRYYILPEVYEYIRANKFYLP